MKDGQLDWTKHCENCENTPVIHPTGLCGVCVFGEADFNPLDYEQENEDE